MAVMGTSGTGEARVRIGLVGPVLPYRGGIAQHTTMLHRSLCERVELCTISFRRQYPKHLYPGSSDLDPEHKGHHESGVHYILDSVNPLTWAAACDILSAHSPQQVIIPWWTFFLAPCFGFVAHSLRKRGISSMFLCHNVEDHESAFWKTALSRKVLSQGSSFLVHSKSEEAKLKRFLGKSPIAVHPHPVYHQFPPATRKLPRRARLELLFFGFVRRYKGLDVLLEAMHLLREEEVFLTIAGEWWEEDPKLRISLADGIRRNKVEAVKRYLSEQETAEYVERADVLVLPYRSATGSGVIPLAYHYGKPVIASRIGGIPEVVIDGVSGRLFEPEDPYALAEVIREFLHTSPGEMEKGVRTAAERMTWHSLAECILNMADKK